VNVLSMAPGLDVMAIVFHSAAFLFCLRLVWGRSHLRRGSIDDGVDVVDGANIVNTPCPYLSPNLA
jgi:hypothetical protein